MPADWSLCQCEYVRNEWLYIASDARTILNAHELHHARSKLVSLQCPPHTSGGYWRAREKYNFASTPDMVAQAWMPEFRGILADTCVIGHLILMLLCSQHFLLLAEDGDPAALQSFMVHLQGIATVLLLGTGEGKYEKDNAHILDVTKCLHTSVFPVDGNKLRAYVEKWLGQDFATPVASYRGGIVNVAVMRYVQSYEWHRKTIPFKERPCVPIANPLCFPRFADYNHQSCTLCCSVMGGEPGCFDDVWTYERCCQRDFDGLHCDEIRNGEERGEVADSIDFQCGPVEDYNVVANEKRIKGAQEATSRQESVVQVAAEALVEAKRFHIEAVREYHAANNRMQESIQALLHAQEVESSAKTAKDRAESDEEAHRRDHDRAEEAASGPRRTVSITAAHEEERSSALESAKVRSDAVRLRHQDNRRLRALADRNPCIRMAEQRAREEETVSTASVESALSAFEGAVRAVEKAKEVARSAEQELSDATWTLDLAERLAGALQGRQSHVRGFLRWVRRLWEQVSRSIWLDAAGDGEELEGGGALRRLEAAQASHWEAVKNVNATGAQLKVAEERRLAALVALDIAKQRAVDAKKLPLEAIAACKVDEALELPDEAAERTSVEQALLELQGQLEQAKEEKASASEALRPFEEMSHNAKERLLAGVEAAIECRRRHEIASKSADMADKARQDAMEARSIAERAALKAEEDNDAAEKRLQAEQDALQKCIAETSAAQSAYEATKVVWRNAQTYGGRHANVSRPSGWEIVGPPWAVATLEL